MKKFNWVDAVIILLVIAVGVGAFVFLKGSKEKASAGVENVKIYTTVEMSDITEEVAKSYKVGEAVTIGTQNIDKGVVSKVEYEPLKRDVANTEKGVFETIEVEGLYVAHITIAIDGTEADTVIKSENEEYRIGTPLVFHGKGFAGDGFIVGLTTEKEGE